jgi:molecular chaperone GrpE
LAQETKPLCGGMVETIMVARRGIPKTINYDFPGSGITSDAAQDAAQDANDSASGVNPDAVSSEAQAAADAAAVNKLIDELEVNGEFIEEETDPLAAALAEVTEIRDRFIRLQAEWDNYRKRTAAEREQERRRASETVMERLLPIIDDLERAIEHSDTSNEESLKEGIAAVYNKLNNTLAKEGLKVINPLDNPFDALKHQAVGKLTDPGVYDETVVQVLQKGYELGGRVLRTAMVVVSEGGPKRDE